LITQFVADIKRGKQAETYFRENYLDFFSINYFDVTDSQAFQLIDTDFNSVIGTYEVKGNYKDNECLIFEEYTNINENLGPISYGWLVKSAADVIVFISKQSGMMIFLPLTNEFKSHYQSIRGDYELKRNKITIYGKKRWQSAFRIIPFDALAGFISVYKRRGQ